MKSTHVLSHHRRRGVRYSFVSEYGEPRPGGERPRNARRKGLAAMNAEKWKEGLAFNTQAVERFGKNNPIRLYGAKFGVIDYRNGLGSFQTMIKRNKSVGI